LNKFLQSAPEIKQEHPLNLSISVSGGKETLLKLNIYGKPIANKYCEGKMKRTLKRGLKDLKSLKRKR